MTSPGLVNSLVHFKTLVLHLTINYFSSDHILKGTLHCTYICDVVAFDPRLLTIIVWCSVNLMLLVHLFFFSRFDNVLVIVQVMAQGQTVNGNTYAYL